MRSPAELDRPEPPPPPLRIRRRRLRTDIVSEAARVDPVLRMLLAPDDLDSL